MTLIEAMEKSVAANGNGVALRVERKPDGTCPEGPEEFTGGWKDWTWKEYYETSKLAARGFLALGLEKKGAVCVYGFNSPEWLFSLQGAIMAGGVGCGVYPTDKMDNVHYKARHGNCNIAVCETAKHVNSFREAAQSEELGPIETLKAIVVWTPCDIKDFEVKGRKVRVISWQDLMKEAEKTSEQELQGKMKEIQAGGVCMYVYTSGTTGKPKAVMLSHDNVTYLCGCLDGLLRNELGAGQHSFLSYLPLSHVAGMAIDIAAPLFLSRFPGSYITVAFARPTDLAKMTLAERIKAVQPSVFLGVPRVWEKIRDKMIATTKENPPPEGTAKKIKAAKERGLVWAHNRQMGGTGARQGGCLDKFIDGKVYAGVRAKLGLSKCKIAITGAAAMDMACFEFFGALGIDICDLYGLSESCGATTVCTPTHHVWGTVGFPMPGAEIKIFRAGKDNDVSANRLKEEADLHPGFVDLIKNPGSAPLDEKYQGEICFRGRHIMMGYMGNPALGDEHMKAVTAQNENAIDKDGWLHSGDKGAMDKMGMIRVTGRFKELIIPAGGENVSPIPIEEHIKGNATVSELVSNVMMVGDKRKYCVALVTLKVVGATGQEPGEDNLLPGAAAVIAAAGGSAKTVTDAMRDNACISLIAKAIAKANKDGSVCPIGAASIKSFTILPVEFSERGGQLTATLKLKRSVVEAEHAGMVGYKDSKGEHGPGMTGLLYKNPDELQEVEGVGKVYGLYRAEDGDLPGSTARG